MVRDRHCYSKTKGATYVECFFRVSRFPARKTGSKVPSNTGVPAISRWYIMRWPLSPFTCLPRAGHWINVSQEALTTDRQAVATCLVNNSL